jgi:hypothetical protein
MQESAGAMKDLRPSNGRTPESIARALIFAKAARRLAPTARLPPTALTAAHALMVNVASRRNRS